MEDGQVAAGGPVPGRCPRCGAGGSLRYHPAGGMWWVQVRDRNVVVTGVPCVACHRAGCLWSAPTGQAYCASFHLALARCPQAVRPFTERIAGPPRREDE